MDAAKSVFYQEPMPLKGPSRPFTETSRQPQETADFVSLNLAEPQACVNLNHDSLEFINPAISAEKPLVSLGLKGTYDFVDPPQQLAPGSIRLPYLQKQAQQLGHDLIEDPLRQALKQRQFDSTSIKALGIGAAGVATAIYSPIPIRTNIGICRKEIAGMNIRPGIGVRCGDGKVDLRTAKFSLSPHEQGPNPWHLDLEYRPGEDRLGLAYDRAISHISQSRSCSAIGALRASLSHDKQHGCGANFMYSLSY